MIDQAYGTLEHDVSKQAEGIGSAYVLYETAKAIWSSEHPSASHAEYEQAMCAIARACGV
jgi:hypothetical protein